MPRNNENSYTLFVEPNISSDYIAWLCKEFIRDPAWAITYVSGPAVRPGRPRLLGFFEENIFLFTISNHDGAAPLAPPLQL